MNSILNIQIDVPERVQTKIETAQLKSKRRREFPASMNELYVFALTNGVETIREDYIDAVLIATNE